MIGGLGTIECQRKDGETFKHALAGKSTARWRNEETKVRAHEIRHQQAS